MFVCKECGNESSVWEGMCKACKSWGTLVEFSESTGVSKKLKSKKVEIISLSNIESKDIRRLDVGMKGLNSLFGGGVVEGSVVLMSGEPGIGKSTLLAQIANFVAQDANKKVVYVAAEESTVQLKSRFDRLYKGGVSDNLLIAESTNIESVISTITKHKPQMLIVDSIQAVTMGESGSFVGSVSQIRDSAYKIFEYCKKNGIVGIISGHITKDGLVAGPKILEHMVDVVLLIEGDRQRDVRFVKVLKNRFGSSGDVVTMKMGEKGLSELDYGQFFDLESEYLNIGIARSIVMDGVKPNLVEIEALVSKTSSSMPRRIVRGIKSERLNIMMGVLSKYLKVDFSFSDVYVNVPYGYKCDDPSLDLALCSALLSSVKSIQNKSRSVYIGEVGLDGSIKKASRFAQRLKFAKSIGIEIVHANIEAKSQGVVKVENIIGITQKGNYGT